MDAITPSPDGKDIVCDVGEAPCDAVTVDALARLQLAARRRGCRLRIQRSSRELVDLIAFMGLGDVLRVELER